MNRFWLRRRRKKEANDDGPGAKTEGKDLIHLHIEPGVDGEACMALRLWVRLACPMRQPIPAAACCSFRYFRLYPVTAALRKFPAVPHFQINHL